METVDNVTMVHVMRIIAKALIRSFGMLADNQFRQVYANLTKYRERHFTELADEVDEMVCKTILEGE